MKKYFVISAVLFFGLMVKLAADGTFPSDSPRTIASASHQVIAEKTGASVQTVITPVDIGKSIVLRQIMISVSTGVTVYCMQFSTSPVNTAAAASSYVTPKIVIANSGSYVSEQNLNILLEDGNGLYMYTSADPNEGWYKVVYDVIKTPE